MSDANKSAIIGVTIGSKFVEWTSFRRKKGQWENPRNGREPIPLPDEENGLVDLAPVIKAVSANIKGDLCVSVPSRQVLLRVLDLPTTEPDELLSMAELQVDKFSPFPLEKMTISCERLEELEQSSRVLIAAVQREHVEALGDPFHEVGIRPLWMDVDVLGWWRLIWNHGDVPENGREAFLILDDESTDLIFVQDGAPLVFRSLSIHEDESDEEFAEEIAEETGYTLAAMESEWGQMRTGRLQLWCRNPPPPTLETRILEECALEVEVKSLEDLPPLSEGIALRATERDAYSLDLSLSDWHEAESRKRLRRGLIRSCVALLLVWLVAMGALFGMLNWEKSKIESVRARADELEAPAKEVKALNARVNSLEQYADRTFSGLELLREVSVLIPQGVDLNSFEYKKNKSVNLAGKSGSVNPIYDFIESLEKSKLFEEIKPGDIRTKMRGGRRVSEYKIKTVLPGIEE